MELSLRKVVLFLMLLVVIFIGIFFISNSSKSIIGNVKLVSLEAEKKSCEFGFCEVLNCDNLDNECTDKEKAKWESMKAYLTECEKDDSKCDALTNGILEAKNNGGSSENYNEESEINKKISKSLGQVKKLNLLKSSSSFNPKRIVLHHTGGSTLKSAENTLKKRGLSIHFMIDKDGTIYQYVDVTRKAFHAGPANYDSIGIEIVNTGLGEKYTKEQYMSITFLISILKSNFIKTQLDPFVIGHFEVRDLYGSGTVGKWDPSPNFNWAKIGIDRSTDNRLANLCSSAPNEFKGDCYVSSSNIG